MQALTAVVLAAFAGYIGAWYIGAIEGNFALLLFLATVVTGAYWVAERLVFLPRRQAAAAALVVQDAKRRSELDKLGLAQDVSQVQEASHKLLMQPWWLDWTQTP